MQYYDDKGHVVKGIVQYSIVYSSFQYLNWVKFFNVQTWVSVFLLVTFVIEYIFDQSDAWDTSLCSEKITIMVVMLWVWNYFEMIF